MRDQERQTMEVQGDNKRYTTVILLSRKANFLENKGRTASQCYLCVLIFILNLEVKPVTPELFSLTTRTETLPVEYDRRKERQGN